MQSRTTAEHQNAKSKKHHRSTVVLLNNDCCYFSRTTAVQTGLRTLIQNIGSRTTLITVLYSYFCLIVGKVHTTIPKDEQVGTLIKYTVLL